MPLIAIILAALSLLTGPSSGGWTPAPTPPFDRAAGVLCDFPIHAEPVVDHVVTKVLESYPDGTIKRDAFKGALIVRVTNTLNGHYYDADASGSAVVDHATDGKQTWYVAGPVLAGFRDGAGNLPRGLYVIDGLYRLVITADGHLTLTIARGQTDNVCDRIG
jgi:hypothetical protein